MVWTSLYIVLHKALNFCNGGHLRRPAISTGCCRPTWSVVQVHGMLSPDLKLTATLRDAVAWLEAYCNSTGSCRPIWNVLQLHGMLSPDLKHSATPRDAVAPLEAYSNSMGCRLEAQCNSTFRYLLSSTLLLSHGQILSSLNINYGESVKHMLWTHRDL